MSMGRAFATKHLAYAASLFFERSLAFLLLPLYTRVLAPAEYGAYAVLMLFVSLATFVVGLGLENGLLRFSSDGGDGPAVAGTAWTGMWTSAAVCSLAVWVSAPHVSRLLFFDPAHGTWIRLSAVLLFLDTGSRFVFYRLLGLERARAYFGLAVFRGTVTLAANGLWVGLRGAGVEGILWAHIAAAAAVLACAAFLRELRFPRTFQKDVFRRLLRFGAPVMAASLLLTLLNALDRYLLCVLASAEEAGLYTVAYRIGFVMAMAATAFHMVAVPAVARAEQHGTDVDRMLARLTDFLFGINAGLALGIGLFLPELVRIRLFGVALIDPAYAAALPVVPWILLGYWCYGFSVNFGLVLYQSEKTGLLTMATGLAVAVNVGSNVFLIPRFGMFGAAVSTAVAYAFLGLFLYLVTSRLRPDVPYRWIRMAAVGTAAVLAYAGFSKAGSASHAWTLRAAVFAGFALGAFAVLRWDEPGKKRKPTP